VIPQVDQLDIQVAAVRQVFHDPPGRYVTEPAVPGAAENDGDLCHGGVL